MNKEIEIRFVNLDRKAIEAKLAEIGAKREDESFFKEWIFAYPGWSAHHRRIRIRTDGKTNWLTYKANKTWEVDSTEEIDLIVSSAEEASKFIQAIEVPLIRYQEKKRIQYTLGDIIFELDFWPKIPMVVEIEAPSVEKVKEGTKLLGLDYKDAVFVDQKVLHEQYYGINLDHVSDYRFVEGS